MRDYEELCIRILYIADKNLILDFGLLMIRYTKETSNYEARFHDEFEHGLVASCTAENISDMIKNYICHDIYTLDEAFTKVALELEDNSIELHDSLEE